MNRNCDGNGPVKMMLLVTVTMMMRDVVTVVADDSTG